MNIRNKLDDQNSFQRLQMFKKTCLFCFEPEPTQDKLFEFNVLKK